MDMAFDPSTMTYLATQMAQPSVSGHGGNDPFQEMMLPLEMPDHQSTYGFAGSEDVNFHALNPQTTPSLKRFSSAYDDPFSDVVSAFDQPNNIEQADPETPSIDRDNKLLSFSNPSFDYTLLDFTGRPTTMSLAAQLHGMFFLAESPWTSAGDALPPPTELTCYRRNLFQITGEVTLPRMLRYIRTESGEQIPIVGQELVITATESTEGNSVKIISVPWKTPANPTATVADDRIEKEPSAIPIDLVNIQEMDSDFASFPFQWKRLQFRIATANNGRRKELQQHFVVRLKVMATLATGGKIPICEIRSGAIIVRGRSPRNFQSRKDMPLSGAGGHARKVPAMPAQPARTSNGENAKRVNEAYTSAPVEHDIPPPPRSTRSFYDPNDANSHLDYLNLKTMAAPRGAISALPPHTSSFEGLNVYAISSPDLAKAPKPAAPPAAPINLKLVEDDSPVLRNSAMSSDSRVTKKIQMPPRPPSFSLNTINSPEESADLLYEYFPLGLDDWMPPVDAVYRPHVVHHTTKMPADPRASSKMGRSKRYFSEDVS